MSGPSYFDISNSNSHHTRALDLTPLAPDERAFGSPNGFPLVLNVIFQIIEPERSKFLS
jgi:hypothetical protein